MTYQALFGDKKPLIGMIHCGTMMNTPMLDLAKEEIEIYLAHGVIPLVENYFGTERDCEVVLSWLQQNHKDSIYGVNILDDEEASFRFAHQYGASFVQIDSVCGHLTYHKDFRYAAYLRRLRSIADVVLLGGVRFKYQPVLSRRTLEEDLHLGAERCDAIVCTGEGTGIPTPIGKVKEFKAVLGDFPVIVGAGVTLSTVKETFQIGDGAIVGSWFKSAHHADYNVNPEYVMQMTSAVNAL